VDPIIVLEGAALADVLEVMRRIVEREPYRLRIAIDYGAVKFEADEGVWTPPYGYAQQTDQAPASGPAYLGLFGED